MNKKKHIDYKDILQIFAGSIAAAIPPLLTKPNPFDPPYSPGTSYLCQTMFISFSGIAILIKSDIF